MDKVTADKIISEYVKKLYGFAVSKTYSLDEAEELSAQIVLEVYRALLSKDNIYNLNGYIYRIASNVFARHVEEKRNVQGMTVWKKFLTAVMWKRGLSRMRVKVCFVVKLHICQKFSVKLSFFTILRKRKFQKLQSFLKFLKIQLSGI